MTIVATMITRLDQQSVRLLFQTVSIRRKNAMMRNLIDKSIVGIVICDNDGVIESINGAAAKMFAQDAADLAGRTIDALIPDLLKDEDGEIRPLSQLAEEVHKETFGQRRNGAIFPVEVAANKVDIENEVRYVAFVNDITLRRQQEEELQHRADHDELTQLPNRSKFGQMLDDALAEARETGAMIAVYLLDLDRFKEVNDTLGHTVGDRLLQDVGARLSRCMTDGATLSRFGGDEFAMYLPNVVDPEKVEEFAGRIISALGQKFAVDEVNLEVGGSIGYALYPENGETADVLLQRADIAMYSAKRFHSGFSKYWAEDDVHSVRSLTLTGDLRRAIEEGRLELVFQPKVKLDTGAPFGAEVLCRWNRPDHGYVSPDEFISHAEQCGLIYPLTKWVMLNALQTAAVWRELGWDLNVAVNLSARLLHHEHVLDLVIDALKRWEYPADRLTLEITENALMVNPGHAMIVVREFASLGVKISIDDFGTGYSSLSYLTTLEASELKIDKSFVMGMSNDRNFETIVKSVVAMAHDLHLSVVGEGVENEEIVDTLRQYRCDVAQGYFYGKPMPADQFEAWLKANGTPTLRRTQNAAKQAG
jgi:diguanylate cyclase (GGDEF)-like protein/PAS domain S-box-containing protein